MASTKKQDKADADMAPVSEVPKDQPVISQPQEHADDLAPSVDPAQAPPGNPVSTEPTPELHSPQQQSTTVEALGSEAGAPTENHAPPGNPQEGASAKITVDSTSVGRTDPNPVSVEVYPVRTFLDEGELRRRGGPSYQVLRRHAEDLERRHLVSRSPLED